MNDHDNEPSDQSTSGDEIILDHRHHSSGWIETYSNDSISDDNDSGSGSEDDSESESESENESESDRVDGGYWENTPRRIPIDVNIYENTYNYRSDSFLDYLDQHFLEDEIYNQISNTEDDYNEIEKQNSQYVIGLKTTINRRNQMMVLSGGVSPRTFFKYSYSTIIKYLVLSSLSFVYNPTIDILQLDITPDTQIYRVVVKTIWLKLIQRHWKKAFQKRKQIQTMRGFVKNRMYTQQTGKYSHGQNVLPNIIGLMRHYAKPTCQKKANTKIC